MDSSDFLYSGWYIVVPCIICFIFLILDIPDDSTDLFQHLSSQLGVPAEDLIPGPTTSTMMSGMEMQSKMVPDIDIDIDIDIDMLPCYGNHIFFSTLFILILLRYCPQ